MKISGLFSRLMGPVILIVVLLVAVILISAGYVFNTTYEKQIYEQNIDKTNFIARQVQSFIDMAYRVSEELAVNTDILTMQTARQEPVLKSSIARNPYFELLYVQNMDGMQTGRSSGILGDRSNRWWFEQIMQNPSPFVSKSYYSVGTGMPCTSIFLPIYDESKMTGIFASDIKLESLQDLVMEFSNTGSQRYSFIIDGEGVVVAHPDQMYLKELYNYKLFTKTVSVKDLQSRVIYDSAGNIATEEQPINISPEYKVLIQSVISGVSGSAKVKIDGRDAYVSYAPVPLNGQSDSWSVITVQDAASAMQLRNTLFIISLIASLIVVCIAIFVIAVIVKSITRPINSILAVISKAGTGDLTGKITVRDSDEIGAIASNMNTLLSSFNRSISDIKEIAVKNNVMGQNLAASAEEISATTEEIEGSIGSVVNQAGELNNNIADCGRAKEGVSAALNLLLDLIRRQSDALERVTPIMNNTSRSVAHLLEITASKQETAKNIVGLAHESGKGLKENTALINKIDEKMANIMDFITIINSISASTGLLAMNASIEAAHAGNSGKGFSVIAGEIRKLSSSASDNARRMSEVITEIRNHITNTIDMTNRTTADITSVLQGIGEVSQTLGETIDGLHSVSQDAGSLNGMFDILENVSKDVGESSASAAERVTEIERAIQNIVQLSETNFRSIQEISAGIKEISKSTAYCSLLSSENAENMQHLNNDILEFKTH